MPRGGRFFLFSESVDVVFVENVVVLYGRVAFSLCCVVFMYFFVVSLCVMYVYLMICMKCFNFI